MDHESIDRLSRIVAKRLTRRTLASFAGPGLAAMAAAPMDVLANKKKKKKTCKGGLTRCTVRKGKRKKATCVNVQTDNAHCGGCGRTCPGGQTCQNGACVDRGCTPDPESVTCDQKCGQVVNNCGTQVNCGNCGCTAWTNQATFGTDGPGSTQFRNPTGVAVSADGKTAWVADSINHRISVWTRSSASSADWTNQTTFGGYGLGANKFIEPHDVAVSGDGRMVCVVDFLNRVSVWTRSNVSSTDWTNQTNFGTQGAGPDQFNDPFGVAVSADGLTVLVADTYNDRISVWSRPDTGSIVWANQATFGTSGAGPDQLQRPMGVAISADGLTAWVGDKGNDRVSVWTRQDTGSTNWTNHTTFGTKGIGPSRFQRPMGVTVSADGLKIWVADYWNNRISVWTRPNAASVAWKNQTTFGKNGAGSNQFKEPMGVAVPADGLTALVADLSNDRISAWSLTCPS
ncbi:MAG: beta-propeller fold lactonase family protein [Thermomicrobiales bacterium]